MSEPFISVDQFRQAHQALLTAVTRLRQEVRVPVRAESVLQDFSERLAGHLGRQDERFFQSLRLRYPGDSKSLKMIEFLEFDVRELKVHYLSFFEKYASPSAALAKGNFIRDVMSFTEAVIRRIAVEEEYLFALLRF